MKHEPRSRVGSTKATYASARLRFFAWPLAVALRACPRHKRLPIILRDLYAQSNGSDLARGGGSLAKRPADGVFWACFCLATGLPLGGRSKIEQRHYAGGIYGDADRLNINAHYGVCWQGDQWQSGCCLLRFS